MEKRTSCMGSLTTAACLQPGAACHSYRCMPQMGHKCCEAVSRQTDLGPDCNVVSLSDLVRSQPGRLGRVGCSCSYLPSLVHARTTKLGTQAMADLHRFAVKLLSMMRILIQHKSTTSA